MIVRALANHRSALGFTECKRLDEPLSSSRLSAIDVNGEFLDCTEVLDGSEIIQDLSRRSDPNHLQAASEGKPRYYRQLEWDFAAGSANDNQRITDPKFFHAARIPMIFILEHQSS